MIGKSHDNVGSPNTCGTSIVGLLKIIEDVHTTSMVAGRFLNMLENLSMTKSIVQLPKTTVDYARPVAGLL